MMGLLKVTAEDLHQLAGSVARGSADIDQELSGLRGQLTPLASEWEGAASAKFQQLWDEWQKSAAGLREALDGIGKLLSSAADTYSQAEQSVIQKMG
jgi:WXG100 family type VII secretion target